jgi:hypothetical protein
MTTKINTREFLEELSRWDIVPEYRNGRVVLMGGREDAREHFSQILKSREFEGALILEMAQTNADIMDAIEERRSIIWAECGDASIRTAIMCNIPH